MADRVKELKSFSGLAELNSAMEHIQTPFKNLSVKMPTIPSTAYKCDPYIRLPSDAEKKQYQSAGVLLERLAESIRIWRTELPDDVQPVIIAPLHGGATVEVTRLLQESFNGIRIEGILNGAPCWILAHQSTVQLVCTIQKISPPENPRRTIGFIIAGKESAA